MINIKNIYSPILASLLFVILNAVPISVFAEAWDGVTSTKPTGAGTAVSPFIIMDGANLKWIVNERTSFTSLFIELGADIDLGGHSLASKKYGGIGYQSSGYSGTFDGKGYTISNLYIPIVTSYTQDYKAFGLFGYVLGGVVKNLIIDGAKVEFAENFVNKAIGDDIKIGVIAGCATVNSKFENIIIRNSEFCIANDGSATAVTVFMGGIVGDVTSGYGGSESMYGKSFNINNVYVDIDFNLANLRRGTITDTGKLTQLNIGGIVGRYRRPDYSNLPVNAFYTGHVDCPQATISPMWGFSRGNGAYSLNDMMNAYSGEYMYGNNTNQFYWLGDGKAENSEINNSCNNYRYYSNYTITAHYSDGTTEEVTFDGVNEPVSDYNGTRTIGKISDLNITNLSKSNFVYDNLDQIRCFQGVNHATYLNLDDANDRETFLSNYNSYVESRSSLREWEVTNGIVSFRIPLDIDLVQTSISDYQTTIETISPSRYKLEWIIDGDSKGVFDLIVDPENTNRASSTYSIDDYNSDHKIEIYICDSDGNRLSPASSRFYRTIDSKRLSNFYKLNLERIDDASESSGFYYQATATDIDGNTIGGGNKGVGASNSDKYAWLWEVSSDPTAVKSWEGTNLHSWLETERNTGMQKAWIVPLEPSRYYRVSFCQLLLDDDGNPIYQTDEGGNPVYGDDGSTPKLAYRVLVQSVLGPQNLIFVYDRVKTQYGVKFGVTTFDGVDISTNSPFPDGSDSNSGRDPYNAVHTIERAYQLVDKNREMEDNVIVIMGYYYDDFFKNPSYDKNSFAWKYSDKGTYKQNGKTYNNYYGKATITGSMGKLIYDGAVNIASPSSNSDMVGINSSTTFHDITWTGYKYIETDTPELSTDLLFYCKLHDLTIGDNVRMMRYSKANSTTNGYMSGSSAPAITIIAGYHNYDEQIGKSITMPDDNSEPGVTTLSIHSGNYGRIISASRNCQKNTKSRGIYGAPQTPHIVKVNVSIPHNTPRGDEFVSHEYAPEDDYSFDIGLMVGGQTDGTVFTDTEINMVDGYIGRYISGNISYGRLQDGNSYPSDSFYGRTILNLRGGEIFELYGGSLGRHAESASPTKVCEAYFYGKSVINLFDGEVRSNIYGAGAGGVSGVGTEHYHTDDSFIPYYDANDELKFAKYEDIDDKGRIPSVTLRDGSLQSLITAVSEVNLYGGIVYGDIYGGGYGYAEQITYDKCGPLAGTTFGDTKITMQAGENTHPTVVGNIYGGGAGSSQYYDDYIAKSKETVDVAKANALDKFGKVACVYGNSEIILSDGTVYGDVFGGSCGVAGFKDMAVLRGNTNVVIDGATVHGMIYGGSALADIRDNVDLNVEGNTLVNIADGIIGNSIFGGSMGDNDYQSNVSGSTSINITGGQYIGESTISNDDGTSHLRYFNVYGGGNVNCIIDGNTNVYIEKSLLTNAASLGCDFAEAVADPTFRRFCVYGGGFGEKTNVNGNANVHINILNNNASNTHNLDNLISGQTFFDVAGGGYSGNVGYWADSDGNNISTIESPTFDDYHTFVSGDVSVTIEGNPFIRKVIGGGFYGSVCNSDTRLISGNVQSIYGGSLMGYVHNKAKMTIGTPVTGENASENNSKLFVLEDIYGGNDVVGIVGTKKWQDTYYNIQPIEDDGLPTFTADPDPESGKGVDLSIYGGTILGDVYGAGNGRYRGYYVPEWYRYRDGKERHYRNVYTADGKNLGRVYRARPMTGVVRMHIGGNNSTDDRVVIKGNVYGGGRSCTVGNYNVILPFEDPRRVIQGGAVNINFGSHVTVEGNVYMGVQGREYAQQSLLPADANINWSTFDGSDVDNLDLLGDLAYDHWYLEPGNGYKPGFPANGKVDGNFGLTGEHMLRGYLKNIEINANVELTFFDNPYEADGVTRRHWLPVESATTLYDAKDIDFNSLFVGAQCGSMTNNVAMISYPGESNSDRSIYQITLPDGLLIHNMVVGGSEDALIEIYEYNPDFKSLLKTDAQGKSIAPSYTFNGGIVTQSGLTYDLVVYNDIHDEYIIDRSPDIYLGQQDEYTMRDNTHIRRFSYSETNPCYNGSVLKLPRYSLPIVIDGSNKYGYAATRESRPSDCPTAVKMSIGCKFNPRSDLGDSHNSHFGSLIFGGCYNSGLLIGDAVINVKSNLLGSHADELDAQQLIEIGKLNHNVGRVYGGGFGKKSLNDGDTYINLLHDFVGMNVFGGGCSGNVSGVSHINYIGSENGSFIYGSIYGGALHGYVGKGDEAMPSSYINLYSGNVNNVYGGSCMGNMFGRTNIYICDKIIEPSDILHINYAKISGDNSLSTWADSRLVVGSVYGGNDIAGFVHIISQDENSDPLDKYSAVIKVEELQSYDKETPGSVNGYSGFPLIGNIYGGSNGNYGHQAPQSETDPIYPGDNINIYTDGEMYIATGVDGNALKMILAGDPVYGYGALNVPDISDALLQINGGTIINVYGGANKANITQSTEIVVEYNEDNTDARAGFDTVEKLNRLWMFTGINSKEQKQEILDASGNIFRDNIYRVFGGNNLADMAIQPTWNLNCGHVGTVYSGGNFGRMTYYNKDVDGVQHGLYLGIDSRTFHAGTVFGGGRVGDISPAMPNTDTASESFFGATLEITDGVIDHVYGGNDVSGNVRFGAKVMIHGAISGDVYCGGNGNHRYKYSPEVPDGTFIEECYDDNYGGRYFVLPQRLIYGDGHPTEAQKLLAINSYRPNIERAYMEISGGEDNVAYVRGNVYCGGNSATIVKPVKENIEDEDEESDIEFKIGDNVVLNGVYLGSNGENITNPEMMYYTEILNDIDLTKGSTWTPGFSNELAQDLMAYRDMDAIDHTLYPKLLDLYMRAVDVEALPKDFRFSSDLKNAYIGDFFVSGNNGSMLTTETINLTFPETLVIYGKIVGGSNSANVVYKNDTEHIGGLTRQLSNGTEKVHLSIKSKFEPWRLVYPDNGDTEHISLVADIPDNSDLYFPEGKCMIYGGCYNSGRTVGDISVDLYSDLVCEYDYSDANPYSIGKALSDCGFNGTVNKKTTIINGFEKHNARSFGVIGAGFGTNTSVFGNVAVRMIPGKVHPAYIEGVSVESPSSSIIYGGSQLGEVYGNTTIEIRDGLVLTNTYGASEAAPLYGSTQTIIGWPEYYVCNTRGHYALNRKDDISRAAEGAWTSVDDDNNQRPTILNNVSLREGDIVSVSLYDLISDADKSIKFDYIDNDLPQSYAENHEGFNSCSWDDIDINIGCPDTYYGYGNVYGGGFVSSASNVSLAGKYTVLKYSDTNNINPVDVGYGGNSMILIWDNKENSILSNSLNSTTATSGALVRDHISVGTGHYIPVTLKPGLDVMGKYIYDETEDKYIHQSPHVLTEGDPLLSTTLYVVESDGGVYGGGRKVFVEGFRDCDISYYGYADYCPQYPKLLNTFQRLDLLTVRDCCLQLQGATDFTIDNVDAEKYALTRIGELSMVSSLDPTKSLDGGVRETTGLFNILHKNPRTRNYVALFNNVLYLSGITSTEKFTNLHRDDNGDMCDHSYIDYKTDCIENYYGSTAEPDSEEGVAAKLLFDKRNLGTAANMIGLNNGHILDVTGIGVTPDGETKEYYGPINGVVEVKLLTLAPNEGGGYVFALNKHENPNHFLETTGNFVFPGAAYLVSEQSEKQYNYIYDDCFPMGRGWEHYYGWNGSSSAMGPRAVAVDNGHGDCNELQEVHYWYVNGTNYYYDLTLTACTYNDYMDFTLDKKNHLVYLYGVDPNSTIKVTNVVWEDSQNIETDIQDLNKDYQIYVSVDGNSSEIHTLDSGNTAHSFVSVLPREDKTSGLSSDQWINNYSDFGDDNPNTPLLGISLLDNVDNSGREYYDKHLCEPENVRLEIECTTAGDNPVTYHYIINLQIVYLLGPTITGVPVIENCALPGEYIFANSFGVDVELDEENMAVTDRNWYLLHPDYDLSTTTAIHELIGNIGSSTNPTKGLCVNDQKFIGDGQVHVPAYLYLNDWQLVHEIIANSMQFYLQPADRLEVHNYHRMRPYDGTSVDSDNNPKYEDLKITAGARIYIEDDADMAYFFEWLNRCQAPSDVYTEDGLDIDPQYGRGLTVFLMSDVKMPTSLGGIDLSSLMFEGTFHGNGYSIDMGKHPMFIGTNRGRFFNTGFITRLDNADVHVFGKNLNRYDADNVLVGGLIENCFLYNTGNTAYGKIDDNLSGDQGTIVNTYRTSDISSSANVDGLTLATLDEFKFGKIAYNLNRFYLEKRYINAKSLDNGTELVPLVDIYSDGDYRYARVSDDGIATALRTFVVPNYHDYMSKRINIDQMTYGAVTGRNATHHNCDDLIDMSRVICDDSDNIIYDENGREHYLPNFPDDYLFFGQKLHFNSVEEPWPHVINADNRVYRASGFYRCKVDEGFHFNLDAEAVQHTLTGIDFAGVLDQKHNNAFHKEYNSGYSDQNCYYAPMLDMPEQGLQSFMTMTQWLDQNGRDIPADHVTRNLIVYSYDDPDLFGPFIYDQSTAESDIYAHIISANSMTFTDAEGQDRISTNPSVGLFHLVDREDYNCPLEFDVTERTWYDRLPYTYSMGNDGWDGICLPFTVKTVYASSTGANVDHGELSHFYGTHVGLDNEEPTHEYWLRKFTAYDATHGMNFDRPLSEDDAINPADETWSYVYKNTYFSDVYSDYYQAVTTDHTRDPYRNGVTYDSYPMITRQMPYIVSYPGERFYEFDLSDNFYASIIPNATAADQLITYRTDGGNVMVITDDNPLIALSHDGYSVTGTFMHRAADAYTAMIDEDETNCFVRKSGTIDPFRVYVTMPNPDNKPLPIVSRGNNGFIEDEDPNQGENSTSEMQIYVEMGQLVIISPYDDAVNIRLYDVTGRLVRVLDVYNGENRYSLAPGFYLAGSNKIRIQ